MHLNYCILFAYFVIGMNETPENCATSAAVKPILARTPANILSFSRSFGFFRFLLLIFVWPIVFNVKSYIAIRCGTKALLYV